MDFYTLLDRVVDLLRQRQRVTYRALQRQFDLDEETLNDLKDELLYAQQVARDEDGRVLVWTGGAETPWGQGRGGPQRHPSRPIHGYPHPGRPVARRGVRP